MSMYDKQPFIDVKGYESNHSWEGYKNILKEIEEKLDNTKKENKVIDIDFYPGVRAEEIRENIINKLNASNIIFTDDDIFYDNEYVTDKIKDFMTEDRVFGVMCNYNFIDFINTEKLKFVKEKIENNKGLTIVYGVCTNLLCKADIHIYCDLARWEIQQRYRNGEIPNWKHDNFKDDALVKFKRGYFFEWRIADKYKKELFESFDYILDTNLKNQPKMISGESFVEGLKETANRPFRVVPFFDPGVWGGQWMKEVCDLDRNMDNYAWCFDCVPEENSLLLKVGNVTAEIPSINVVFKHPKELLGEKVYSKFGEEFPIRFDFLDTMDGKNLSLQVHPLKEYAKDKFNMDYTQEESYYILDAKEDANVYLGLKTDANKEDFFSDLEKAQECICDFDAEKYVNKIPTKKHEHFLIPPGTIHCSGSDTMVLEVSSTPYIFTFKLWDWGRLGMDGKPRPIHIEHGKEVLQFNRDTNWTYENIVNNVVKVAEGDGWIEEKTGLHSLQFIETRRHWFTKEVEHDTKGNLNVINLIEGDQIIVESLENTFEPFIVNYAETFIVPASVGKYKISPYGNSEGKKVATLKAYVR
ncbi:MAG: class I mannose-6-phosphate isomerase [Romboutsia sp.]|uniref:class I mannose-6-phosphate isomerase n=1 Tax=Romboutsia sp. TaxID=1965302 RepID=UPI003F39AB50